MLKKRLVPLDPVILTCGAVLFGTLPLFAGPSFEARSNDKGGVSIEIKPKPMEPGATVWEFDVTINTHVKALTEDLTAVSVLIEDKGQRIKPIAWRGDKPGGHHRTGVLQFPAPADIPTTFELQMSGVGGADQRTFRWEFK